MISLSSYSLSSMYDYVVFPLFIRRPVILDFNKGPVLSTKVQVFFTNFNNKGPSSQSYGFSSSHVWIWELDYKESWVPKKGCFWTVVLEKTLESPFDCKEIQLVYPKGDLSWMFSGRTNAEAETPILWPPNANNFLIWKGPDVGKD